MGKGRGEGKRGTDRRGVDPIRGWGLGSRFCLGLCESRSRFELGGNFERLIFEDVPSNVRYVKHQP
jgi:hypothetical protein